MDTPTTPPKKSCKKSKMTADETDVANESPPIVKQFIVYCGACGNPPEYCEYGPDFEDRCLPWLRKNHPEMAHELHSAPKKTTTSKKKTTTTILTRPPTFEERLTAFYNEYEPTKVSNVPSLLEKYAGKQDKLFTALTAKYGPEPDLPDVVIEGDDDDDDDDDSEEDDADEDDDQDKETDNTTIKGQKGKRRGVAAKKDTTKQRPLKVIILKDPQKKKGKNLTIVRGLHRRRRQDEIKLKDMAKIFAKKFAGSSSVKKDDIIIQGDHVHEAAVLVVDQFGVPEDNVWLVMEKGAEPVPFKA